MARDSLFGERIVWKGRCAAVTVPFVQKVMATVAAIASAVMVCYAVVVAKSLAVPVGGMILFAAWCATLALAAWRVPIWWRSQIEYLVTDRHVIWRRGRIRRSIEISPSQLPRSHPVEPALRLTGRPSHRPRRTDRSPSANPFSHSD